jgi:transcriptional regulator with XRE-family HTH domain
MKVGRRAQARQVRELRARIGRQVADLRLDSGATIGDLARCCGIDPAHLWRIEAGQRSPSLEALVAIAACLGTEPGVRLFPNGGPRIHDRFQAPMVDALIRLAGSPWRSTPEVPVPAARGVIDLVLRRSLDQLTVACECHSELRRLELAIRRAHEKADALRGDARESISTLLLLRSTATTREVAATFAATLNAAYPARVADALAALRGTAAWPGPAIVWARVERGVATILDGPPRGVRLGR